VGEADAMTDQVLGAPVSEPRLVETGNYPDPEDGPQDHLQQTPEPQFDDQLVDGADYEGGS
jgi:hypothetical protein